ncbi:MAG: hypothetical protein R3A44_28550 [Caldilineaceae bacterium]
MYADDKLREECGVFGIYAPKQQVATMTFFALYALQHRGQEAAGIVTCDGRMAHVHKGMGLVSQVFNEENLSYLRGHLGIGHTLFDHRLGQAAQRPALHFRDAQRAAGRLP